MVKRTTVELDEKLLERARLTLGQTTTRATIEEALRRAIDSEESTRQYRRKRLAKYFDTLEKHADLEILASEEMWR